MSDSWELLGLAVGLVLIAIPDPITTATGLAIVGAVFGLSEEDTE